MSSTLLVPLETKIAQLVEEKKKKACFGLENLLRLKNEANVTFVTSLRLTVEFSNHSCKDEL